MRSNPSTPLRVGNGSAAVTQSPSNCGKSCRSACFWFFMGVLCTVVTLREYSMLTIDVGQWSALEPFDMEESKEDRETEQTSYLTRIDAEVDNEPSKDNSQIDEDDETTPHENNPQIDEDVETTPGKPDPEKDEEVESEPPKVVSGVDEVEDATSDKVNRWEKYQYHKPEERKLDAKDSEGAKLCGNMKDKFSSYWALDLKDRSRSDEDKRIYNLFFRHLDRNQMQDFHYVELGAFDGIQESNTRFFDVCLGWNGLLIEPNPKIYPRLVSNRPHAHRMSYAASCSVEEEAANKTVRFWASAFTNAAEDVSPNREAYAKSNLATDVPCGSLNPVLLDLFPSKRIHFFSLDTEGVEYSILTNIDFDEVFIDVLISENWNNFCQHQCEGRDKVRAFMKSKGFLLYPKTINFSDLYVHPLSEFAKLVPTDEVRDA